MLRFIVFSVFFLLLLFVIIIIFVCGDKVIIFLSVFNFLDVLVGLGGNLRFSVIMLGLKWWSCVMVDCLLFVNIML